LPDCLLLVWFLFEEASMALQKRLESLSAQAATLFSDVFWKTWIRVKAHVLFFSI